MPISDTQRAVYELLTSEDDGRVCRDIPEEACDEQPQNFLKHVVSLGATKTGDGLADAKLVLAWLLSSLGAPAYLIGLLVPLREAGALLPQLFIASTIRSFPLRKWVWSAGSVVQGLCVIGMGITALVADGTTAGWVIVALLSVFAVARSLCSVSYKDVLGKTVSKATRGTATGTAATIAATLVLLFGFLLSTGVLTKSVTTLSAMLFLAGGLWVASAAVFATLAEKPGATEGGGNPMRVVISQFSLLRRDPQLVRFIVTRGLLVGTALAPPYLLALAGRGGGHQLGLLGPFVVASALAAVGSTYIWGRLSDTSSRRVLMSAAVTGAAALTLAVVLALSAPAIFALGLVPPLLLFLLMVGYQGVRLGRATHVVDMADAATRAAYTALSNTLIGTLLIVGGGFGLVAEAGGETLVLGIFAAMCALAAVTAHGLDEVQADS